MGAEADIQTWEAKLVFVDEANNPVPGPQKEVYASFA
jgi:hypothetical protein